MNYVNFENPVNQHKKSPTVVTAGLLYFNLFVTSILIHIKFLPSPAKVKVKIKVCIKIISHLSNIFGCKSTVFFHTAKQSVIFFQKKTKITPLHKK
jgi:hypothetical protein